MLGEKILQNVFFDFLLGGALVAIALAVGSAAGAVFGGLVAALPIRLGATLLIGGFREGNDFALKMAEGSLLAYFGTFAFLAVLLVGIPRIGLAKSFAGAIIADIAITVFLFKIAGKM
jgi:hypothetical protein